MRRRWAAWTLWSLLLLIAWDASGLDLALARAVGGAHEFPLHDHWLLANVLHQDVLPVTWLFVAWLTAGVVFPTLMLKRLDSLERLRWAASAWLPLLAVNLLKLTSTTSCPWDLVQFGGLAHYVSHWSWGTPDGGSGHCFPAGHASAGFVFMSGYFVWGKRDPLLARRWLVAGLLAGCVLGVSQQMRGAHYLSHTVWTGWICWTVALGIEMCGAAIRSSGRAWASGR